MKVEILSSINDISEDIWQSLSDDDPFTSFAFYKALEQSGSVGENTGWIPAYLILKEGEDILGIAPNFIKLHSYGEYVFDHQFADALERAGGRYYPKLLMGTPFTPANSNRFLTQNNENHQQLLDGAIEIGRNANFSSIHINYASDMPKDLRFIERHGLQYHFFNRQYQNFDEFLMKLTSAKRKNINKERRAAEEHQFDIQMKLGAELSEEDWDCFWQCYQDTGARKWGTPYLTRSFFEEISQSMSHKIVMALAYKNKKPVASALNFFSKDRLLGRYWGSLIDAKFLHFELCYYQAIEFAIRHQIPLVEAGAQGEHKMLRGYEPVITKSYHHFYQSAFHNVVDDYIENERAHIKSAQQQFKESNIYKSE